MTDSPAFGTTERRVSLLFAFLVIAGLMAAAWQAHTWSDVVRARNLIVVAPDGTNIRAIDGPTLMDQTHGVHTWSVVPGPLTLEVDFEDSLPQRTTVMVPKGLGGLMLAVNQNEDGKLVLAYF